ncbi:sulfite reductase subunit beta (hemoprotein) [Candidatus Marinamargulisbacteria bacterium SCGC AAA071-K20]|nr:sulfite reductase subunit beta (hemoprotein) [Candidatus Marinamargulisbacteria bacterium SCGC AAA071-K20]
MTAPFRFYQSAPTLIAEQDQFEKDVKEFTAGNIHPVKFKGIRVAHGVYEQRQEHTYMIRIRCAAGGITPQQLKKVAELGDKYGGGEVHFTTRQEVQVHEVLIQDVLKVIRGLNEVGLSSRGGGGNTIRNILTSPLSGVEKGEAFDVDPYAIALTTRMIHEADSWNLPRKFKISLSNSAEDTGYTQVTCLGFVAKINDKGEQGFEVYTAGGMGAKPMVGRQLYDFIPENKVYQVTKAMKIMFDKNGNRRSKYSNRIKFLWKKLDRDEFVRLFEEEYNKIKDDSSLDLVLPDLKNEAKADISISPETVTGEAFELWKKRYVEAQKQDGLVAIKLPLRLGDIYKEDADVLCDVLAEFGENVIRCDRAQNMRLRNIPEAYIGNIYNAIQKMKMHLSDIPAFIGNMINCTGASTCKLGICLPRGLSDAIKDRLVESKLNLDNIPEFKLNMSGCPNTCGMHHVADLGFFGKIGRKEGEMYPAYNVLAGATVGAGITKYAVRQGDIASHHVPDFVHDFLENYIEEREDYDNYHAYLEDGGIDLIKSLCEKYKQVPLLEEDPGFYKDHGARRRMRLDDMGTAECSAGMFDMINVDKRFIDSFSKALEEGNEEENLFKILFHSSRMLLVTRGLDSKTETQAFELFGKHFVQTALVDERYGDVVTLGKLGVKAELPKHKDLILELAGDIQALYKKMDDSLRFNVAPKEASTAEAASEVKKKDYRGVACPMNFVKTKIELEPMGSGQKLEILLDDGEPINNVPNSVKLEGHKVLEKEQNKEGYWRVLIEKK